MDTAEFHNTFSGFKHRMLINKFQNMPDNRPVAYHVKEWLTHTFGNQGEKWIVQPMASPKYLVYWFREERDYAFALLKWR